MLNQTGTVGVHPDPELGIGGDGWSSGSGATTSGESIPSSQLPTEAFLQHCGELAEGDPELAARWRQVAGLVAKNHKSLFRGGRGSLCYQSVDGD